MLSTMVADERGQRRGTRAAFARKLPIRCLLGRRKNLVLQQTQGLFAKIRSLSLHVD